MNDLLRGRTARITGVSRGIGPRVAEGLDPDLPDGASILASDDVADAVLFVATRPDSVRIPVLQIERA